MKRSARFLLCTLVLGLMAACATSPDTSSKDSGLYGSIGVGRTH